MGTGKRAEVNTGACLDPTLLMLQGEVRMSSFENGIGEKVRRDNWDQVGWGATACAVRARACMY